MKIENEVVQFAPMNLMQIKIDNMLLGLSPERRFPLNPELIEILDRLIQRKSLSQVIELFIAASKLPSFENLVRFLEFLVSEQYILNPNFKNYFRSDVEVVSSNKAGIFEQLAEQIFGEAKEQNQSKTTQEIPFLRNLDPEILKSFLQHSRTIRTPAGVQICQAGTKQRSMFVLLQGQAHVLKNDSQGKARKVATLQENAVFGEVGFFLNEPRTADVVTATECSVLKIKYLPEIYDQIIKSDKARQLQQRFWLIHALLKSEIFRELPDDCFDALIFAGQVKSFPKATMICNEGEQGQSCYIVVQGSLNVTQKGKSIRTLNQGDLFGEIALLVTGGKRSASVQAENDVLLLEINWKNFYQLMAKNLILARDFERIAISRMKA